MERKRTDLFDQDRNNLHTPLADRMRPRTIDEFIGQDHIMGPGRLLRRAIQADQLSSIIFSGPPGTGKTTLARIIANTTKGRFISLNAVLSGVKDVRNAIAEAGEYRKLYGKRSILFVDEVHRWNKAQQDALLPWVENGTVILIGATTENPFFEVNSALVSRSRIFQLNPLSDENLYDIGTQALNDSERGYGNYSIEFEEGALDHLVKVAAGDARTLLNAVELAVETTPDSFPPPPGTVIYISTAAAEESIQKKAVLYDKEGDYHFDIISAFIKSLRGGDPDAALYWMARMIAGGEDPHFLFRRMLILAAEDVGLADPQALILVQAAAAAFDRVGMPEGQFHLAQAALYLATCPKSNTALAYFDAMKLVREERDRSVPSHLKDANRDKEGFGHGEGYQYPHAFRDHWVAQQYLPADLKGRQFYEPSDQGCEGRIRGELQKKRQLQIAVMLDSDENEVLTFSPARRDADWMKRISELRNKEMLRIQTRIFSTLSIRRHHLVLVLNDANGLLLWEARRRVPEGGVYCILAEDRQKETLRFYTDQLPELERPQLLTSPIDDFYTVLENDIGFEQLIGRNILSSSAEKEQLLTRLFRCMKAGAEFSCAELIPKHSTRLSSLLPEQSLEQSLSAQFEKAEEMLYSDPADPRFRWDSQDLLAAVQQAGLTEVSVETEAFELRRFISAEDISRWFAPEGGGLGKILRESMPAAGIDQIRTVLSEELAGREFPWRRIYAFIYGRKPGRQ